LTLHGPNEVSLAPGEIADLPVSVALLDGTREFSRELQLRGPRPGRAGQPG